VGLIGTEDWTGICPAGIFAAESYLAVNIPVRRSATQVDAATVQSARLHDVGVANQKKSLHVVKEMPKNLS